MPRLLAASANRIFVYVAADDVYRCPAGERLTYRYTNVEDGKTLRRYWTSGCKTCALKAQCTTGTERRITRWEHEAVLEKVQDRLDHNPAAMGVRRQTVEHPFGTIKCWMGWTHFLTKRLPKVATEMALNVLAYNMKRVMAIIGVAALLEVLLLEPGTCVFKWAPTEAPGSVTGGSQNGSPGKLRSARECQQSSARGADTRPFSHSLGP